VNPSGLKIKVKSGDNIVRVKTKLTRRPRITSVSHAELKLLLKNSKINEQHKVTQTEGQNAEMSESDASEHNEDWHSPSEGRRIKKPKTTTESQNRLELKNTYDPLKNAEENEEMDTAPSQYTIKFNTNIYTRNKKNWTKVQEVLKSDGVDFHTYMHKNEKTHAFVLRGLDQRPAPKEIAEALLDENINMLEIYSTRGTNRHRQKLHTGQTGKY
jgi:hypothetical protein